MGMTMRVTTDTRRTRAVERRLAHPTKTLWRSVGAYLADVNRKQFVTEGRYLQGGRKWKALKPDYLKWKVEHGYPPTILVRTGRLMRSYTSRPMAVEHYSSTYSGGVFDFAYEYGSDVPYAKYHHFGTRYMARRRVTIVTKAVTSNVADIMQAYFETGRTRGRGRV